MKIKKSSLSCLPKDNIEIKRKGNTIVITKKTDKLRKY